MRRASWVLLGALSCVIAGCGGGTPGTDAGQQRDAGSDGGSVTSCAGAADGTPCAGGAATLCIAGECVESACGDGFVDTARGEDCDDGNENAFDGCEPGTCRYTCTPDEVCDDGLVCNGAERCVDHRCVAGDPAPDGTACSTEDVPSGVCHPLPTPVCEAAACGDGMRDECEDCDDGRNGDDADGCRDDCRFTCSADGACSLRVTPAFHDYGAVPEGTTSAEQTFMVENMASSATAPLQVRLAGGAADELAIATDGCSDVALASFGVCMVGVVFRPSGAGARQAMLVVEGAPGEGGAAELRGVSLGELGRACTTEEECASGSCVDGVCCEVSACTGCSACNVAGSEGSCSAVPAGEDPHGACAAVDCSSGTCDGSGGCAPGDAGAVCQRDSCSGFSEIVRVCDGVAAGCPAATTSMACAGGYFCADSSSCATSCTSDSGCQTAFWCDGTACMPDLVAPAACTRNAQCVSGICAGGLCRNCLPGRLGCGTSPYSQVCAVTADGANQCTYCTDPGGGATCSAAGVGGTCVVAQCECSSTTECTHAEGPHCIADGSRHFCACYYSSGPQVCPFGRSVCVSTGGDDTFANACKGAPGEACSIGADCASGSCTTGACD